MKPFMTGVARFQRRADPTRLQSLADAKGTIVWDLSVDHIGQIRVVDPGPAQPVSRVPNR